MRITIALLAAALLAAPMTAPAAAQAEPHQHESIRYASVKGCTIKGGGEVPCGHWRLVLHSGERRVLPDAQVVARLANGKSAVYPRRPDLRQRRRPERRLPHPCRWPGRTDPGR